MDGPFPDWEGPKGVKADGGGCTRGRGKVGGMVLHRAVNNKDVEGAGDLPPPGARVCPPSRRPALSGLTRSFFCAGIIKAINEDGCDVNEVEAAGNTPLHNCAYAGWIEGAELLLKMGAKVNASNNAGDRPVHWALNMRQDDMVTFLEKVGGQAGPRPLPGSPL